MRSYLGKWNLRPNCHKQPTSLSKRRQLPKPHCCLATKPWPTLLVTPWTVAYQASLFVKISRQKYWSGLPFPSQGIFSTQGLNLHWQADALLWSPQSNNFLLCFCVFSVNLPSPASIGWASPTTFRLTLPDLNWCMLKGGFPCGSAGVQRISGKFPCATVWSSNKMKPGFLRLTNGWIWADTIPWVVPEMWF